MISRKKSLEIIHKLKLAGSSQRAVAKTNGVKPQTVWNVIWGHSTSKPIKETIARIIGEKIEELWPEDGEEKRAA